VTTNDTASRRQILLVDDNPGVRETLAMLLMRGGYDVAVAEDGFAGNDARKVGSKAVAGARRTQVGYTACLKGCGYCDPSRLTLEETRRIHPAN